MGRFRQEMDRKANDFPLFAPSRPFREVLYSRLSCTKSESRAAQLAKTKKEPGERAGTSLRKLNTRQPAATQRGSNGAV